MRRASAAIPLVLIGSGLLLRTCDSGTSFNGTSFHGSGGAYVVQSPPVAQNSYDGDVAYDRSTTMQPATQMNRGAYSSGGTTPQYTYHPSTGWSFGHSYGSGGGWSSADSVGHSGGSVFSTARGGFGHSAAAHAGGGE